MTHALLMELATQRENELAVRARRKRSTDDTEPRDARRTPIRNDRRMVTRLRSLVTGA
jgi:hypothetical protein